VLSLRVTRDKRGYEHIYLIADGRRRGRTESRLVYWCRMPGGLRVGREPFDADTRETLERGNPDLMFDWPSLTKSLEPIARGGALGGPAGAPRRRGAGRKGAPAGRVAATDGRATAAERGKALRAAGIVAAATADAAASPGTSDPLRPLTPAGGRAPASYNPQMLYVLRRARRVAARRPSCP
jgi:hypothetical protein